MKDQTIILAMTGLLFITLCVPAQADGFKFPTIPNPFKKPAASDASAPASPPRMAGSRVAGTSESSEGEGSSFSFPKPKLPKFDLPGFARETTTTRQSRANQNRRAEPSVIDKFSSGTKSFFSKAKTTLMPWTSDTASTSSMRTGSPSGSGSRHSARTNGSRNRPAEREASASNGFSFPWSKPKPAEEESRINSPTDFLRLERPKYY